MSDVLQKLTPTTEDLRKVLELKWGDLAAAGSGVRMRFAAGYFSPDEHYEALVAQLVSPETTWLDVGCGKDIFPTNPALSRILADRAQRLVGLDPDHTLQANSFVHEKVQVPIEQFETNEKFDLITFRMVAEHITNPGEVLAAIARLTRPGGRVVIYTVNKLSLTSLAALAVPFKLHHPAKKFLWGTEEEDTFPVAYRMNTRKSLQRLFCKTGFREERFELLADACLFWRFRRLHKLELVGWKASKAFGLPYLDSCLLGVYKKNH